MPREPDDEETVTISIRMPAALHADAARLAKEEDRSISAVGVRAIREYVRLAREAQRKGAKP